MSGDVVLRAQAAPGTADEVEAMLRAEGLRPTRWSNGPGFRYGGHDHPYDKVLVCTGGGIVFHTGGDDVELGPGDRLELRSGTTHSATVGPAGVACVEAPRPPRT
jgi:quercetin dioxygenase-like cupin family protein